MSKSFVYLIDWNTLCERVKGYNLEMILNILMIHLMKHCQKQQRRTPALRTKKVAEGQFEQNKNGTFQREFNNKHMHK